MNPTPAMDCPPLKPWSLSRFPNHGRAAPLEVIDALVISNADFIQRYVKQNRPCLVKNAVRHWPAFEKWQEPGYLKANSRNQDVVVRSVVVSEVIGWSKPEVREALKKHSASVYRDMPFHEFLDGLQEGDVPLVADSCRFSAGSAIEPMKDDVGGLPFMPVLSKSRHYPGHRSFLYRNSYTDWHFHSTDETFMAQVVGAKEVLLLAPDDASWQGLRPVIENEGSLYNIDTERFPCARALSPLRAVVEPGDALYIPVFWWHAVESIGEAFGATVAATFPTPLQINGDLRFPVARKLARSYLFSRYAPLVVAAVAYSYLHRLLHGDLGRRAQPAAAAPEEAGRRP